MNNRTSEYLIAHLADIHLRLFQREDEYRQIFSKLEGMLEQIGPRRIVISGDIFHNKITLSPECVNLAYDLLSNLSKIADVDIIIGNHDLILSNRERLDSVSPIVKTIKSERIHLYTKSGIYDIDEYLSYGIFSLLDPLVVPINFIRQNKRYIAIYHGIISGAVASNDYRFSKGEHELEIFKNYDIAFLGDIHKQQFLSPTIAYSGSLITQNYSESNDKGFLLWNIVDLSSKFVVVQNDWSFNTVIFDSLSTLKKCTFSKYPRIRVITQTDISIKEENEIKEQLIHDYNPIEIIFKNDVAKESQTVKQLKTADKISQEYTIELLTDFLDKKELEPAAIKNILHLHKSLFAALPEYLNYASSIWTLDKVRFSNMFSYGNNNELDFTKLRGVVGLFAKNRMGKSSFIDVILNTITGKNSKSPNNFDVVNNKEQECSADVWVTRQNTQYRINRIIQKTGTESSRSEINLFEIIDGQEYLRNEEKKSDTDKLLRKFFGSFEDLTITSFSLQGRTTNFVERTYGDSTRIKTLSKFLGLDLFEELFILAKSNINNIEQEFELLKSLDFSQLIDIKNELEQKRVELAERENELSILNKNELTLINEIIAIKSAMNGDVDLNIENDIAELQEVIRQKRVNLDEVLSNIESNIRQKERLQQLLIAVDEDTLQEKIKQLEVDLDKYKRLRVLIETKEFLVRKDEERVKILDKQKWCYDTEICQSCGLFKEAVCTASLVQKQNTTLTQIKNALERFSDLGEETKEAKNKLEFLQNAKYAIMNLDAKILLNEQEKNNCLQEIDENTYKVNKLTTKLESYSVYRNELNLLKNKETELTKLKSEIELLNSQLVDSNSTIKFLSSKIDAIESNQQRFYELDELYSAYKIYMQAVSKEGIPYSILCNSINAINSEINKILQNFVQFTVLIELDLDNKDLAMRIVYEDGTKAPIEASSGMEKTISAIAIRAALVKIANISKCNIFVLDEFASTLDAKYLNNVELMLNYLKTMFDIVLIVTHTQEVQDLADVQITINRENNRSRLIIK
jgi:DNA repair exonuclease SbcCD ATPase subunit